MEYGIWCLLPPLIIIAAAVLTRNTIMSLLLGTVVCCVMRYGTGFVGAFIDLVYRVGGSHDTVWYEFFVILFACMLGMWSFTGATQAVADKLQKYATTPKKTLFFTWLIGAMIFIDDFTSLAVNGTMTRLADKNKVPRAMLAYVADSAASPVCMLAPFGTWAIFYQSVFSGYGEVAALGTGMEVYIRMVPYLFYGWVTLLMPLFAALGWIRPLGSMKEAYRRAQTTGELYSPASRALNPPEPDEPARAHKNGTRQVLGFVVPLAVYIAAVMMTGDVIIACLAAIAVMAPMFLLMRLAKPSELMRASLGGIKDLIEMILIVFAAYMLKDALADIGLTEYVISVMEPFLNPQLLPFITFTACSFLTFASGSNWGATLTVAAVIIPLCASLNGNMILVLAAIVSGAAFGAYACFYCDVSVFAAAMMKIDNIELAIAELPYGLIGMAVSAAAYLAFGFLV